ncbi:hypothetical protein KO528_16180 [Saccharophagus degradans]|uniref:hypothetical protein n=1 Tax=Saccharophagus degradans TaxID=86304 RepID=UPI001C094428|nr:hypothetical protein [Saccharophagus degradans]MBU2986904.1 hypothetical protein [Saccharophagus degradans]WGO98357.1 hypothetical protein QFX18_20315 [Saccharophagus degradans]
MSDDDDFFAEEDVIEEDDSSESEYGEYGNSLTAKEAERARLQAEMEAFLASGGRINEIPANVVADPPKKPTSSYGGQPI